MIARKPLPANAAIDLDSAPAASATMQGASTNHSPPSGAGPAAGSAGQPDAADSDVDSWERASASESDFDDDDDDDDKEQYQPHAHGEEKGKQPESTRGAGAVSHMVNSNQASSKVPPVLDGPWEDEAIRNLPKSTPPEAGIATSAETNPFRRKMSISSGLNSANVPHTSTEMPPLPSLPPPPVPGPPSDDLANLSLGDTTANPWKPALDEPSTTPALGPIPAVTVSHPAHNIWDSPVPSRAPSTAPPTSDSRGQPVTPVETPGWSDDAPEKTSAIEIPASFQKPVEKEELEDESHAWDDVATDSKGKAPMIPTGASDHTTRSAREEEWNLIDNEPLPGPSGSGFPQSVPRSAEKAPVSSPYNDEKAPPPPPRTPVSGKTETYQVKNINWDDAASTKNPRKSPILVQNANGPCPLMALVNALTLTTPVSADDAVLVTTLRTREQISLDLLLDAVFDELMSERRTNPDQALPDITELYSFLKGLHTGMNVNPRFIPTEETEKAFKRTSLTHLHPTERGDLIPGTFEDTQEMGFYRIFKVPLIHGWLPSKEEPVYGALQRHAASYEDAQNVLFREEELEDKLSDPNSAGLTEEEQAIYQDILSIKSFLHTAATQLTPWGLEVITKAMRPGSVAILFRNDHFSTLYRHPQTLQIFTLVTDAGYAGHQEVVWESLADVNGESSEFFSGDFRVVGGPPEDDQYAASGSSSAPNAREEWPTGQKKQEKADSRPGAPPLSPKEQEDRDLALALQLQEEEDQRHHAEQAQRRRETQLSEQFIEQQSVRRGPVGLRQPGSGSNNGNGSPAASPRIPQASPPAPPTASPASSRRATTASTPARGGSVSNGARGGRPVQQIRPLVPPVLRSQGVNRSSAAEDVDDAPPSYEDAARDRPYVPPAGHPSHPSSNPNISMNASTVPRLPGSRMPSLGVPQQPPGFRRGSNSYRPGVSPAATSGGSRDKDCVVM